MVKGYEKAELIGDIEDLIFSNIAEYDSEIADICNELFDTNDFIQLKQLKDFLEELLNEIREEDDSYIIISKHIICYHNIEYLIERKGLYWIANNIQYDSLVDFLEELATF